MAANIFIGVNEVKGIVDPPASLAATTQSVDVEVNILTAHVTSRKAVITALEKIKLAVEQYRNWPPI